MQEVTRDMLTALTPGDIIQMEHGEPGVPGYYLQVLRLVHEDGDMESGDFAIDLLQYYPEDVFFYILNRTIHD